MHTNMMGVRKRLLMKTKVCTKCNIDKNIEEFYRLAQGRHSMCHKCKSEYNKKRYHKLKKRKKEFGW